MAVKALVGAALLVAITLGILLPVPHGDNKAEARTSTLPGLELNRS